MSHDIAVIGDKFMSSRFFMDAIEQSVPEAIDFSFHDQAWPGDPMFFARDGNAIEGIDEYMGSPAEVIERVGKARILVTHLAPVCAEVFQALPQLEMVVVSRGGPVNVDMKAASEAGVKVVNVPGRNASAVAEFTIGSIIAETRHIARGHEALRNGVWRGDLYRADMQFDELSRLTVGLIGYGEIGTRVVTLLRAFGGRILVADPYKTLSNEDQAAGVQQVLLEELLAQSDIVSLHARVTEETRGFMNASAFEAMKKGAIFINTARGPMVDQEALCEALAKGHLGGAMLETFAIEPLPANTPLRTLPNVTLTPHIAGASLTTVRIAAEKSAEEVRRHLAGEPPLNPCKLS